MPPNPYPATPPKSFSSSPSATGTKNIAGDDPVSKAAGITSGQESGGNYRAVGEPTRDGDRAYGKYQVMGKNIPQWTQEALGRPLGVDEFLNSDEAQEAVYKKKMGEYIQKYGPDAGKAWFAGEHGMNNPNARAHRPDGTPFGPNVAQYGGNFAAAFSGPDGSSAPAAKAIEVAASGKTAPPPASGVPTRQAPSPTQPGQIYVNPSMVPNVPQYSREQVEGLLSNPWATNEQKERIRNEYIRQNQPIEMAYPGGKVLINPRDHTQQQFIAEPVKGESKIGDISRPIVQVPDGKGNLIQMPVIHPPAPEAAPAAPAVGPRSEAAPSPAPTGPTAAPTGAPATGAGPEPTPAPNAPTAPVQVASTDPAAAFTAAGAGSGPRPVIPPVPNIPTTPFGKFAASGAAPPGIDPQDWAAYTGKKDYDIKQSINEDSQKKAADFAAKKYDTLSTQAQAARKQMPNLDLALTLMNDPNFHSGITAGLQDTWARLKAATGIDAMANAPNEAFDKIISSTVLGSIKDVGG
ncbi:hypothetical protein GP486_008376, partial [Trichoglossum hirsutum]